MRVTGYLPNAPVREAADGAALAAELGLDRVWAGELAHDPFLPLAVASSRQPRLGIGTAVSIAFARTPWVNAAAAWDLAEMSGGNFVLGLGTQVRSHVRRRFGGTWESPVPWLRDYVGAVRAIWTSWSEGTPLRHEGPYFDLSLSAPHFDPGPLDVPAPPVFIAGVNERLCRLAGEVADGFLVHGLNSPAYIAQRVVPELTRTRARDTISVVVPVITGTSAEPARLDEAVEEARRQVAFYASTPSYRTILEVHGLEDLGAELGRLAAARRWRDMTSAVDDTVLDTFALTGTPEDVGRELARRYTGIADEVALLLPVSRAQQAAWTGILEAARSPQSAGT